MKKNPSLADIINLEFLLYKDRNISSSLLHKRDREIYLNFKEEEKNLSSKRLILKWLKERSKQEFFKEDSPGFLFLNSLKTLKIFLIVLAFTLGILAGSSFFTYSGKTPINVFQFFFLFIILQLFLTFFLIILKIKITTSLFQGLIEKSYKLISKNKTYELFLTLKNKSFFYKNTLFWLSFLLSQLFALFFNIGLFFITFFKILSTDLAFGWQSTLITSDLFVYKLAKIIATPWSFFLKESAYPTLTEISGTHIILKDGIYNLSTSNLVSWWPFLLMSLLTYGIFLRLVSFIYSFVTIKVKLNNLSFLNPQYRAIERRMKSAFIVTTLKENEDKKENKRQNLKKFKENQNRKEVNTILLLDSNLYLNLTLPLKEELKKRLSQNGFNIIKILEFQKSYEEDKKLLDSLKNDYPLKKEILLVTEGWMVPINSFTSYVKKIREVIPENMFISIGLISKFNNESFLPIKRSDFSIWENKINLISDPYINLFSLVDIKES